MSGTFQRTGRSRADLVRLFAATARGDQALAAATLGFVREPEADPEIEIVTLEEPSFGTTNENITTIWEEPLEATPIVQTPLWRFEAMTFRDEPEASEPTRGETQGLTAEDIHGSGQSLFATPKPASLAPWSKLWPRLRQVLQATVPSREPDVAKWVHRVAQGEMVTRIPRLQRKAWPARLSVWIDRSRRLVPFWADQIEVCRRLYTVCDRRGLDIRSLDASTQSSLLRRRGDFAENVGLDSKAPLLVLGDLGCLGTDADRLAWRTTGERLRRLEIGLSALVPLGPARWNRGLGRMWKAIPWEQGRLRSGLGLSKNTKSLAERAEQLLTIVSPAAYLQPGLLRALRLLLPPEQADAATEADVWNHADVRGADAGGMVLHAEAAEKWRHAFAAENDEVLKERVSRTIRHWHEGLPRELLRAETLVWLSVAPNVGAPGDERDALDFAARLEGSAIASGDDPQWADLVKRYGHALLAGMPAAIYERIPALQTVWVASFQGAPAPSGIDPAVIRRKLERPGETRHWWVRQVGASWVFGLNERGTEWPSYIQGPGSPLAWFEASRPWVTVVRGQTVEEHRLEPGLTLWFDLDEPVELRTDRCTVRLAPWVRESWTIAAGRDRFGLWADAEIRGVVQRFRWIPPGRFLMGSPESEVGRFDNEGPQHSVEILAGYWLGEVQVTQGLWKAVMGNNPSHFQSAIQSTDGRPVEQVSWNECTAFTQILSLRLPAEAEWEYACRAGTSTATWVGGLEILGTNNSPQLDAIAWYGGNCGVAYDLDQGYDATNWSDKQHEFARGGTRAVGEKDPNPFGLYDILGNVYEWCGDVYRSYNNDAAGPHAAGNRVVRGGSWFSDARYVRAAYRFTDHPGYRNVDFGFRLARDADPDKPKQGSG